ncbi:MAG: hypothetical protein QME14_00880 [Methanobacteriaceae archaeon]|nr:hypothetical protein [Methanobacteriaceae archaeon]
MTLDISKNRIKDKDDQILLSPELINRPSPIATFEIKRPIP